MSLQSIEDRLSRISNPGWSVNEGFEPEPPLTTKDLAEILETIVEEVQSLKGELESHAQQQHHSPDPF